MKSTFHVLGLAHQPVTQRVPHCAYTMKVLNMCRMLKVAGQTVVLYHAGAGAELGIADHYVHCVDDDIMVKLYGERFDQTFNQGWAVNDAAWVQFRRRAARKIGYNLSVANDIVLASFGTMHQSACPTEEAAPTIEMGIGYEGVFARRKVFESYAWQHFIYGRQPHWTNELSMPHDTVIPNYIDPTMFHFSEKKLGYALYLGRVVSGKGVRDAVLACKEVGMKLVISGDGDRSFLQGAGDVNILAGGVGIEARRKLLAEASVLIAPTKYVEPFGGVAIEAAYSGTPVISSDTGGFTETVINGRTGYRVRDMAQLVTALRKIDQIDPAVCHEWGKNFTLENVWPRYAAYFEHQLNLYNAK